MAQHRGQDPNQGRDQAGRDTSTRGFASMDPAKQRAIAAEGGRAAHAQGVAHEFDSEEAREAGRKGGQARGGGGDSNRDIRAGSARGSSQGESGGRDSQGRFTDDTGMGLSGGSEQARLTDDDTMGGDSMDRSGRGSQARGRDSQGRFIDNAGHRGRKG